MLIKVHASIKAPITSIQPGSLHCRVSIFFVQSFSVIVICTLEKPLHFLVFLTLMSCFDCLELLHPGLLVALPRDDLANHFVAVLITLLVESEVAAFACLCL